MSDPGKILEPVNQHKRQQFETKLRRFMGDSEVQDPRTWTIENYERHYHALRSTISDVETHLTDIDDRIAELEGGASRAHFTERIQEEIDDDLWNKVHSKTLQGRHRLTFARISENWQELSRLRARKVAWKTYQLELARVGIVKLYEVNKNLYTLNSVVELLESIDEKVDNLLNMVKGIPSKIKSFVSRGDNDGPAEPKNGGEGGGDENGEPEIEVKMDGSYKLKDREMGKQRVVLEAMEDDSDAPWDTWSAAEEQVDVTRPTLKGIVKDVEEEYDKSINIVVQEE